MTGDGAPPDSGHDPSHDPELSPADRKRLAAMLDYVRERTDNFLGYPVSKDFDYRHLAEFLRYPMNNLGDPFTECLYGVGTRDLEREVTEFFAELFRADRDDWWGYVTNGGSEGNLYGLYLAREFYPDGMVYFSQDTHYSVNKNVQLLGMRHIMIRSRNDGEIDYDDLRETLRIHRDKPPIVFANVGTTMTEARDDVARIRAMMDELAISKFYIHSDAALCGPMAPFLDPKPAFDFADGADSIAISGHKFIGSPIPSGVVLAKKRNVDRIARSIAYIGSLDTTITGSRNGLTPLILWAAIRRMGVDGLRRRTEHALAMAAYAEKQLKAIGIAAWRNPNALTVVFPEAPARIRDKYQLATAAGITHVITMPNVTREEIDAFVADLDAERNAA